MHSKCVLLFYCLGTRAFLCVDRLRGHISQWSFCEKRKEKHWKKRQKVAFPSERFRQIQYMHQQSHRVNIFRIIFTSVRSCIGCCEIVMLRLLINNEGEAITADSRKKMHDFTRRLIFFVFFYIFSLLSVFDAPRADCFHVFVKMCYGDAFGWRDTKKEQTHLCICEVHRIFKPLIKKYSWICVFVWQSFRM